MDSEHRARDVDCDARHLVVDQSDSLNKFKLWNI